MTYELTKESLFNYFDPAEVSKIIRLPLIQRHLSTHEYKLCKAACAAASPSSPSSPFSPSAAFSRFSPFSPKERYASTDTVLDFEALQRASISDVIQYLSIPDVRAAYIQVYGEYFAFFESQVTASKDKPHRRCGDLFPVIDEISEKKLILSIKGAVGLPLQAFNNALLQQDFLLQAIALEFTKQASKAQKFMAAIQERDIAYKENVINLAFSFVRLGLSVVNAGELLNVSARLSELAAYAFGEIEARLPALILGVQNLVVTTHYGVLAEAERGLFSTVLPADIESCWAEYRIRIFEKANSAITNVLKTCVTNDNFFRCIIRETLCQHKNLTYDMLFIKATEKAEEYFKVIAQGLLTQVAKIQHMKDAVVSEEGSQKIECYYRKIGLINYAKQHEGAASMAQKWITKKFGHLLSFYFPEIFQKKWTGNLYTIFHRPVPYCKQLMLPGEYQERRLQAVVILATFGNSSKVRDALYMYLEEQIPHLSDCLIKELQEQNTAEPRDDVFVSNAYKSVRHYSFKQRKRVLFDFSDSAADTEAARVDHTAQPASSPISPVVLMSHRRLSDS